MLIMKMSTKGGPLFTFSLPGGGGSSPCPLSVTPLYDTHTAQESGSRFWCHAVMSLQFTHVRSVPCRGRLRNLLADCSILGLDCVTIAWQQTWKVHFK